MIPSKLTKKKRELARELMRKAYRERESELHASPGIERVYVPSPDAINFIIDYRASDLSLSISWGHLGGQKDHIEVALLDGEGIAPIREVLGDDPVREDAPTDKDAPTSEEGDAPKPNFAEEAIRRHHTGEYPLRKNPIGEKNRRSNGYNTYQAYDGREVERGPFIQCPLDEAISYALKLGKIFHPPGHEIKGGD